jgi:hypothetical protein
VLSPKLVVLTAARARGKLALVDKVEADFSKDPRQLPTNDPMIASLVFAMGPASCPPNPQRTGVNPHLPA